MSAENNPKEQMRHGIHRDLTQAKIRLNEAVGQWTQVQRLSSQQRELAREELHSAVIGLWLRMEPHLRGRRGWENLQDFDELDREVIWSGIHPVTSEEVVIKGLSDVEEWIEKTVLEEQTSASPNAATGQETIQRRIRLPVEAAIEVSRVLSIRYKQFGLDVNVDDGEQQTKIDRDLLEEVDEWRQKNV
jgi:hypothetical protein